MYITLVVCGWLLLYFTKLQETLQKSYLPQIILLFPLVLAWEEEETDLGELVGKLEWQMVSVLFCCCVNICYDV